MPPSSIGKLKLLRYLNLSFTKIKELPESIAGLCNLQTLNLSFCHEIRTLPKSLGSLANLRFLNLYCCCRLQSLPESIGNLENLRILNLCRCSRLQSLPESIGNLKNLRILNLFECSRLLSLPSSLFYLKNLHDLDLSYLNHLQALPEFIGNLENLRILNLSDCLELKGMPRGIGKLVSLSELPIFVIGKQDRVEQCASISELEHLNNLDGGLEIKGLENVTNPADAMAANLIEKKKLWSLKLKWNVLSAAEDTDTVQPAEEMDAVLENLQPHQELEYLVIEGYAGGKFPSWMMNRIDSCLPNLVKIIIVNIPRCSSLPLLGLLPVLEVLIIRNMAAITNLGVEFDGDSHINESANKFPALRRLELSDMPVLREWVTVLTVDDEEGRRVREPIFPRLVELTLERCPQLRASVESLRSLTTLESLTITNCEDLERIEDWLRELTKMKFLNINRCSSLRYLPVHKMTTLTYLSIEDCPLLFNAGGDVRVNERLEPFLPSSVEKLDISGISKECLSLILKRPTIDSETPPDDGAAVSLQQPNMGLRRLTMKKCQQLTCLPEGLRSFMSLEHLTIEGCEDLERIEDWLGELTKLYLLNIWNCLSLRYLPAHKMTTLRQLYINGCPLLFNADGQFVDTNVDHIRIVKVDRSYYKYKKRVSNSSQEEEKKSWTGCWGKLDWPERRA